MPENNHSATYLERLEKHRPKQKRAIRTYESILESTALLLEEQGLEKISTNLIASKVGITVPALYRYFPNKQAVYYALSTRLMDSQNQATLDWYKQHASPEDPFTHLDYIEQLLHDTLKATQSQTAGLAILRMMRVVPELQQVRLLSHSVLSEWATRRWSERFGIEQTEILKRRMRLILELGTAAVEMALDDPDMTGGFAFQEYGRMVHLYWHSLLHDMVEPFA